jgi:hypothetical protein
MEVDHQNNVLFDSRMLKCSQIPFRNTLMNPLGKIALNIAHFDVIEQYPASNLYYSQADKSTKVGKTNNLECLKSTALSVPQDGINSLKSRDQIVNVTRNS